MKALDREIIEAFNWIWSISAPSKRPGLIGQRQSNLPIIAFILWEKVIEKRSFEMAYHQLTNLLNPTNQLSSIVHRAQRQRAGMRTETHRTLKTNENQLKSIFMFLAHRDRTKHLRRHVKSCFGFIRQAINREQFVNFLSARLIWSFVLIGRFDRQIRQIFEFNAIFYSVGDNISLSGGIRLDVNSNHRNACDRWWWNRIESNWVELNRVESNRAKCISTQIENWCTTTEMHHLTTATATIATMANVITITIYKYKFRCAVVVVVSAKWFLLFLFISSSGLFMITILCCCFMLLTSRRHCPRHRHRHHHRRHIKLWFYKLPSSQHLARLDARHIAYRFSFVIVVNRCCCFCEFEHFFVISSALERQTERSSSIRSRREGVINFNF